MEERFGPSHLWIYDERHHEIEDDLDVLIDLSSMERKPQPKWLVNIIKARWINRAFETNDKSVKELVDDFPTSFGVVPTIDYLRTDPKINCQVVKKGKTNVSSSNIQRI